MRYGIVMLPKQIKQYYDALDRQPEELDAIIHEEVDGKDQITLEFKDDTADVWAWETNPESRDTRFPRHWALLEQNVPLVEDDTMVPVT